MGYSLALDGKRDKAQKYYEKTLEIDPDNVAALNNLANILLDQGKEDEALKYLNILHRCTLTMRKHGSILV